MAPKLFINIVAWNSMDFLPDLLDSIYFQTYTAFEVLVIDNGSNDGLEPFLREHYPQVTVLRNMKNLGFSPAHNQGIKFALNSWKGENLDNAFVLVTNPDVVLSPTFVEEILREVMEFPEVGSFGGKLLRAYSEHMSDNDLRETVQSDRIDSTGLVAKRNRTFHDRGAGEMDEGQYDESRDVFGISGALALYRASALEDVRFEDEYFDQDFFAYKEDVDIAWRLQHLGWKSRYIPSAVAYHYRNMFGKEKAGILDRIRNRRTKSKRRSFYSNRNHWSMIVKNELFINALLAFPWIAIHESARFFYVLFFEPSTLRAFGEAILCMPTMLKKRTVIMKKRKVPASYMRKWFAS